MTYTAGQSRELSNVKAYLERMWWLNIWGCPVFQILLYLSSVLIYISFYTWSIQDVFHSWKVWLSSSRIWHWFSSMSWQKSKQVATLERGANGMTSIMFWRVAIVLSVIKGETVSESLGGRQASLQEPSNIFRVVLLNNQYCYEKHFPPNSCIDLIGKTRVEKLRSFCRILLLFLPIHFLALESWPNSCFLNARSKEQHLQNIKWREYTASCFSKPSKH